MENPIRHKRGDIRSDGRLFWDYRNRRGKTVEVWCKSEEFTRRKQNDRERAQRRRVNGYRSDPIKEGSRNALKYAVATGKIRKPLCCQDCFRVGLVEGHHTDYSKPYIVAWLCRPCHGKYHRKAR